MNTRDLIEKEVALIDEKNYLMNILEEAEDSGRSLEEIIQDKIDDIYNELDSIAINKLEGELISP